MKKPEVIWVGPTRLHPMRKGRAMLKWRFVVGVSQTKHVRFLVGIQNEPKKNERKAIEWLRKPIDLSTLIGFSVNGMEVGVLTATQVQEVLVRADAWLERK